MHVTKFLTKGDIWPTIARLSRKAKKAKVVTAYLGWIINEQNRFRLKEGDTLIVALSPSNAKDGLINPAVLREFLALGVKVYALASLHAKVYLFDDSVVVGSNNASRASMTTNLVEAAIFTNEPNVVAEAETFIDDLCKKARLVDEDYIKECLAVYSPPVSAITFKAEAPARMWMLSTYDGEPVVGVEQKIKEQGAQEAEKIIGQEPTRRIRAIKLYTGSALVTKVREFDPVILVHKSGDKVVLRQPAFFVHYKRVADSNVVFVYLLGSKTPTEKKWSEVSQILLSEKIIDEDEPQGLAKIITSRAKASLLMDLFIT